MEKEGTTQNVGARSRARVDAPNYLKSEFKYERRQTAGRMEAIMVAVSGIAVLAAIFALLSQGWLPGLLLLILGALAFALSRVFDLLGDLFASIDRRDGSAKQGVENASKTET